MLWDFGQPKTLVSRKKILYPEKSILYPKKKIFVSPKKFCVPNIFFLCPKNFFCIPKKVFCIPKKFFVSKKNCSRKKTFVPQEIFLWHPSHVAASSTTPNSETSMGGTPCKECVARVFRSKARAKRSADLANFELARRGFCVSRWSRGPSLRDRWEYREHGLLALWAIQKVFNNFGDPLAPENTPRRDR